jgi:hypothetical protein
MTRRRFALNNETAGLCRKQMLGNQTAVCDSKNTTSELDGDLDYGRFAACELRRSRMGFSEADNFVVRFAKLVDERLCATMIHKKSGCRCLCLFF